MNVRDHAVDPDRRAERDADRAAAAVAGGQRAPWLHRSVDLRQGGARAPAFMPIAGAGAGLPLDRAVRQSMEHRFAVDFAQVRVHADAEAAEQAHALQAQAFTVGSSMVFGAERYRPATDEGRQLLAHELAHVVQQRALTAEGRGSARPVLQRKPAVPVFAPGDLVELRLPALRMATEVGGGTLAATLRRGDRLRVEGVEVVEGVGRGQVFRVTVIDPADPDRDGKRGVVRVEWVQRAVASEPPLPAAAGAGPAAPPPAGTLHEFDLDPDDPDLPLKSPGYKTPQAPPRRSVLDLHLARIAAAAPLTQALAADMGIKRSTAQLAALTILDLRADIVAAARATGKQGIPPQLLGAVIAVEMVNRSLSMYPEIVINRLLLGDWSIGVSQLKLSSAAMTEGSIPWIEAKTPAAQDRQQAADAVKAAFEALPRASKQALFDALVNTRTAVPLTARYLAKLKNRPNRFPALEGERMTVFGQGREAAVIGTEYNQGPSGSPGATADPSDHGLTIAHLTYSDAMRIVLGL